jgi:NADH-quinone oxidoreductase subunit M
VTAFPILSAVTFLPLVGALAILALRGSPERIAVFARWIALVTTLIDLALAILIWVGFDTTTASFQLVEKAAWIGGGISYHMGVDGISMLFIVLTAGLMPFCILASWKSIETRVGEYMVAFLALETLMIGVFCALDLVLFYLFFEGGLIPMFLIIGVWGGKRRVYASFKFFLYTLLGSVLMLLAILAMYVYAGTTDIETILATVRFPVEMQTFLWLAFFASFAVKLPMWPVHTWLPDAHVEAPTAGSVILAGILLKMGGYGFLRFSVPMFAQASATFTPFVFALSIVAIIYTSLVALAQEDMKKLIAYSSVAHMGFVTMGIFTLTRQGIDGGIFQMLSHGVVSGALFLCVGVVYDRMHTREIDAYGGLVNRMPMYAAAFMVFTLANVGLPGTSGFVGEFLTLLSAFAVNTWVAILATTGVILSVAYALYLYRRVIFGDLVKPALKTIADLSLREVAILAPLVIVTIVLGIYPKPILDVTGVSVQNLIAHEKAAMRGAGELREAQTNKLVSWPAEVRATQLAPHMLGAIRERQSVRAVSRSYPDTLGGPHSRAMTGLVGLSPATKFASQILAFPQGEGGDSP